MTVFMIGYDLYHKDGAAYDNLEEAIKSLGSWWHCLDSTWLVNITSNKDAGTIRDALNAHLGKGDKLLVMKVATPTNWASWNLPDNCNQWLKDNA
ncbi:SinR family protein [Paraburkholderia sp. Ac-20336]|uniref:hypothetical protein n=1 Tax=Paraburkholderia sp. Ac-20336 TaxID=2703886 RepID=UPI00197F275B|nr:hypothetical protein [Paraburkholderia sp. Ac-20336]MBN3807141.1 SinR family protein [Paraburkholderia sp. Ac-20336]